MTQKQANPYPLRLAPDLAQWVKERAKNSDRSINAEINQLLKHAREAENRTQLP